MGRTKLWSERLHVTLPAGAKTRIAAVLAEGEDTLDLVRAAIDKEVRRRERAQKRSVPQDDGRKLPAGGEGD
ncbi:hypothetical protein [Xanthobacter aminoxidans]|uniref:AbrB/MazE/SpoVT family DNA-binding domain-containing protein n=1 Tax=Xanthobacter aminoxidans TaxID=186280 RepID=A0ABW6ZNT8_9HYPH